MGQEPDPSPATAREEFHHNSMHSQPSSKAAQSLHSNPLELRPGGQPQGRLSVYKKVLPPWLG